MIQKNKKEIIRVIKYIFSAGSSFALDLLLFTLFHYLLNGVSYNTIISTVLARILSSIYNYFINSKYVFENQDKKTIIKYFVLVVIQMIISSILVSIIENYIKLFVTIIKFVVDIIIFVVNYIIQKKYVFKK